jgi:hypothetical protein
MDDPPILTKFAHLPCDFLFAVCTCAPRPFAAVDVDHPDEESQNRMNLLELRRPQPLLVSGQIHS